jgi:hypothetical protein
MTATATILQRTAPPEVLKLARSEGSTVYSLHQTPAEVRSLPWLDPFAWSMLVRCIVSWPEATTGGRCFARTMIGGGFWRRWGRRSSSLGCACTPTAVDPAREPEPQHGLGAGHVHGAVQGASPEAGASVPGTAKKLALARIGGKMAA